MKSNFRRTAEWLDACGKTATAENLSVQIGVHIEEFLEFLACVDVDGVTVSEWARSSTDALSMMAHRLKTRQSVATINPSLRASALDALCDSEVTGNGVAYLAGFRKELADQEVLDSNDSKLEDGKPVILPGGKIGKGKNYKPPSLRNFV